MASNTPTTPKVIDYSWETLVKKADPNFNKPDTVYNFSGGREMKASEQMGQGAFYKRT